MAFDWRMFLEEHRIPYVEQGNNVKRGDVNLPCPLCGSADPSEHMGVSLTSSAWACWRDPDHRGRRPDRLIVALLGCSYTEAAELAGDAEQRVTGTVEDLAAKVSNLFAATPATPAPEPVDLEPGFVPIPRVRQAVWKQYLRSRGFGQPDAVSRLYDLRACRTGRFGGRLILPLFHEERVVGWTGRSIRGREPRYLSHPKGGAVKEVIFNYDLAQGARTLVVTEGPLDALKVDFYGRRYGIRAVALLGVSPKPRQLTLISRLAQGGKVPVVVALDSTAPGPAMRLAAALSHLNPRVVCSYPGGVEDPGDLDARDVLAAFS